MNIPDNVLDVDYSDNERIWWSLNNSWKSIINAGQHFLWFPKDIVTNIWDTTKNVGDILFHPKKNFKNIPKAIVAPFTNIAESFLNRNIWIYSAWLDWIWALGSTLKNIAHWPSFLLDKLVRTPLHNINEKLAF